MNKIINQLQKENEKTISKYMNQPNIKYYPQFFNMKSIIKKNLENDLPIKEDINNDPKDNNLSYHSGGIKKNRIKCYKEMNHELLKAEERKKQEELEEEKRKRKKYIDPKLLEKYFKRNEQELLDNILKLNEKLLTPINENENESEDKISVKKDINEKTNDLPMNIIQLYLFGTNFSCDENDENGGNNFFVYHKKDRWICFPHSDCVVVDQYIDDITSNIHLKKNQIVLNKHKNKGNLILFLKCQ